MEVHYNNKESTHGGATYNVLHAIPEETGEEDDIVLEDHDDDEHDNHGGHHGHGHGHGHGPAKNPNESFDFTDCQSFVWKKGKGTFWTANRMTTAVTWCLVVLAGIIIGLTGGFVAFFTEVLTEWKLETCYKLMEEKNQGAAFFAFQFISLFLALCAGALCWKEPAAAGSGIPEIKAYLNGVNLNSVVRMPVLVAKVVGMCFSCSAGLPLGKEGPMIHAGSIIGGAVSQGNTISIGFDTSWNVFQDLRNDHNKRDFVTFGAAAGIAAAFRAPIGGILFTLEEGASFWSTSTTFRAFVCAVITQLTLSLTFAEQATSSAGMFAFGQFENLYDGRANFSIWELPIFFLMGCLGGAMGALFNNINERVSIYRKNHLNAHKWKRIVELSAITLTMSFISFILPLCWQKCTRIPAVTPVTSAQETALLDRLVPFQCEEGEYNELASLYFTSGDISMRQLFHFREMDGVGTTSFTSGPLILFFIPYFLLAAVTSGVLAPAGLFVPTLLSGAAYGRLVGHWMNAAFPFYAADSGTYALIGAAAILGGMARMTIAGTIIILEACGNITYLLPLMVTFLGARYAGNFINEPMYDMQIRLKEMPFLEGTLHTLGLLNYHPISQVMTQPVVVIYEVDKVRRVWEILQTTNHNGFPVVNRDGKLRGLILRKSLLTLLKYKAYSTPISDVRKADGGIPLQQAASVGYDTLERVYPNFPDVKAVKLSDKELNFWLDVRTHMDPSPISVNESTTISRCYILFRTMGLRHVPVVDGDLTVVGIVTRATLNEHRLHHYWEEEGERLQKELKIDSLPPAIGYESRATLAAEYRVRSGSVQSDNYTMDSDVGIEQDPELIPIGDGSDSPALPLRKKLQPVGK